MSTDDELTKKKQWTGLPGVSILFAFGFPGISKIPYTSIPFVQAYKNKSIKYKGGLDVYSKK
jgi:hypothetical protein